MASREDKGQTSAHGDGAPGRRRPDLKVVVAVVVAAALAVAFGLNIFAPLDALVDAGAPSAAEGDAQGTASAAAVPEPSSSLKALSSGGVSVKVPDNWVEAEVAGVKGASPTDDLSVGYVTVDAAAADAMSEAPSVDSADTMEAFARTMAAAQGASPDADVAVEQDAEGRWCATVAVSPTLGGVDYTGSQRLVSGGATVYVVTAVHAPDAPEPVVRALDASLDTVAVE